MADENGIVPDTPGGTADDEIPSALLADLLEQPFSAGQPSSSAAGPSRRRRQDDNDDEDSGGEMVDETQILDYFARGTSCPPPKRARDNLVMPEDSVASEPTGPTGRRYFFVSCNTVRFAIPEGYEVDPTKISYLGGGAYGNVIRTSAKCRDGITRSVTIKKLRDPFADPINARRIYREIKLLQLMRHDNVICALDLYTPNPSECELRDVYVVTEYAGRSIYRILRQQQSINHKILLPDHVKFIIYQLLRALKYIHSANIIHRDLKPGNLALTDESDLTVLDFGLARSLEKKDTSLTQYVMTRWYRSPEVIYWNIDTYTSQADMWSVGCIAAELLTGEPLFPGDDVSAQYTRITQLCGSPDKELMNKIEKSNSTAMRRVVESFKKYKRQSFEAYFSASNPTPEFIDFLEKVLVLDPEKRLTVAQAIQHPYLTEFYLPEDEPVAKSAFELNDCELHTREQWRGIVWREVLNFQREQHSPLIPGESLE